MLSLFSPGQYVRHPLEPEWGIGQVQSSVADRVTINFEHAGKQLIITSLVELQTISAEEATATRGDNSKG